MKHLSLLLFACLFASCASLDVPNTGFLQNREQLTRNKDHEVWGIPDEVELYVAPNLDASQYRSVYVEPSVYRPSAKVSYEPSPESIANLERDFSKYLSDALGKDFEIADHPGPGVLHVRAAIAEIACERVWVNVLTVILIVPTSMGGISGQIEILDGASGERLIAMAAHRDGSPFLVLECFNKYAHARWGMRKWSTKMRKLLSSSIPATEAG